MNKVRTFLEELYKNHFYDINGCVFKGLKGDDLARYTDVYIPEKRRIDKLDDGSNSLMHQNKISLKEYNDKRHELRDEMSGKLLKKLLEILEIPE